MQLGQALAHTRKGGSDDNGLGEGENEVECLCYFDGRGGFFLILWVLIGGLLSVGFLVLYFGHIGFAHADHDEVGEDIEKEDRHAHEEEGGDVRVDEISEPPSDQAEVRVVDKMVDSQQSIPYVLEVY